MTNTKFSLGFSPCPNDTFIFDALVNNKIDTEGITFVPVIEDVEALNNKAFKKELDITKLSFYAFANVAVDYELLDSGSALGKNCGPILISKNEYKLSEVENLKIAIPGNNTTANCLLGIVFPNAKNKKELLFSDIEGAILRGRVDAGVIIHENRFTYQAKGLKKIIDLGEYWETNMKMPIPLGGIAIKKDIQPEIKQKINRLLRKSISFAMQDPSSSADFIKKHAQAMDEEVTQKHIKLYVNEYTRDLGFYGKNVIVSFYKKTFQAGITKEMGDDIFLNKI
jgi:1,4-dihydroxy-6-naphthoate synthase